MIRYLEKYLNRFLNGVILKDFGWKRSFKKLNNEIIPQWCDPNSGHCYSEKTALKLVKIQALDYLNIK